MQYNEGDLELVILNTFWQHTHVIKNVINKDGYTKVLLAETLSNACVA